MEKQPLIYIVDDDRVLCENTAAYLGKQGFLTRTFHDVQSLEAGLAEQKCDLLLLDIMLPSESGLEYLKRLGNKRGFTVIFVSALGEESDRVVGLELGADDYLVKPFFPRELVARIRISLRRPAERGGDPDISRYEFAGWTLETKSRMIISPQGVSRSLRGSEFRLLKYFLEHPKQIVDREVLIQVIGCGGLSCDQVLDVQISRLRVCLGEKANNQRLLKTSRGNGYIFSADVELKYE